jgi:hypothetical protein
MPDAPSAYPLTWPPHWPRTAFRDRKPPQFLSVKKRADGSKLRVEIRLADARDRLADEIDKLRGADVLLSTDIPLRANGQPRLDAEAPGDPGAAVYFDLHRRPLVLACDRWNTVAGNVAAIAAHIGALRAQERWGVGSIEQAFTGYQALPAPESWRAVLGISQGEGIEAARAAWLGKLKACGNQGDEAVRLNAAMARARQEIG